MHTVGAFEAKTKLAELLDRVGKGEEITITRHNKPVARLVPVPAVGESQARAAIERLRAFRKGMPRVSSAALRKWRHEGHGH